MEGTAPAAPLYEPPDRDAQSTKPAQALSPFAKLGSSFRVALPRLRIHLATEYQRVKCAVRKAVRFRLGAS